MTWFRSPLASTQFERQYNAHVRMIGDTVSNRFAEKQQAATTAAAVFVYPPGGRMFWSEFEVRANDACILKFSCIATLGSVPCCEFASPSLILNRPRLAISRRHFLSACSQYHRREILGLRQ